MSRLYSLFSRFVCLFFVGANVFVTRIGLVVLLLLASLALFSLVTVVVMLMVAILVVVLMEVVGF